MGTLSLKSVDTNPPWRTDDFVEKLRAMRERLTESWPIPPEDAYPEAAAQRRAILEETALVAVLACHTIEVKDPSLPGQSLPPLSQSSTLPFSSQLSTDLDSQPLSSQPSSSQPSNSQSQSSQKAARRAAEAQESRAAVARLSNLATNINSGTSLAGLTQHPVLGRWDEAGLEDYTAFIEQPAAAQQDRLRRRMQRQAEKRKAKEEAFKRLTGREAASSPPRGASQRMGTRDRAGSGDAGADAGAGGLSQGPSIPLRVGNRAGELMSSQTQVTMSQPVGGAFGGRPVKRKKKKGGIK